MHAKLVTIFLEVFSSLISILPPHFTFRFDSRLTFPLLGVMFRVPMATLVVFCSLVSTCLLPIINTCFFLHGAPVHTLWEVAELNLFFAFECYFQAKAAQTCQILRIIWGCSFQIHIRISGSSLENSDYLNCSVLGVLLVTDFFLSPEREIIIQMLSVQWTVASLSIEYTRYKLQAKPP